MKTLSRISFLLFFSVLVGWQAHGQQPVSFPKDSLSIQTGNDLFTFTVEIAKTQKQRARGLMYRKDLAEDAGMLFDYGFPQQASMWMKNTFIPLDMLFIRSDGTIEKIVSRTTPHSLASITSRGEVRAVLELKGGTAERLGIGPGSRVLHPIFIH